MSSPLGFLLVFLAIAIIFPFGKANFNSDFDIVTGIDGHATILDGGEELRLSMDKNSGSGVASKTKFLFGKFDARMKLIARNSAGTVTSFYLSSEPPNQDEIDFEFLGHVRGDLYVLQTNIFTNGKGDREQRFHLWFDPTQDFHTYTILWNPLQIIMYVDDTPIRLFKRNESLGVDYIEKQPVKVQASLWNGEDWATEGGTIKIDWSKSPFFTYYRNYSENACIWYGPGSHSCGNDVSSWMNRGLEAKEVEKIAWAKKNYMIYNYCDKAGTDETIQKECSREFS
ncbi:uncharacterized protein A4U43_C06F16660 [Asparagus officinalis]|uniref:Xyloglucan endotransglucosylase/hydrolase n=1 Tax=Asparagus officinalis TaxID=4686 RepID=A0A5P1EMD3_ASPOF|nr:xyloglucan endotransglucosylase/hydrolase protein 24-like [Asparagus officinalis]ONK67162.1 uncharacterized protein A4U43_C06F16660 [Asparagus officinalis]